MKCHFVYAVPFENNPLFQRIKRKIRSELNKTDFSIGLVSNRHPGDRELNRWPKQSPFENTKNIYRALSEKYPTVLYHLTENIKIKFSEDDIFIGHPFFPYQQNGGGVTEYALTSKVRPKILAIISPLHCDTNVKTTHINKEFLDHVDRLMPQVDILFAIMGEYWWKQWDSSPYAHWKPKMIRLDMAVDVKHYPFIKKKFNKPGQRKFLYIGKNDPMKGTKFLSQLALEMRDFDFGWIGSGPEIEGVKRISGVRQLTPRFMSKVAEEYDFFISLSRADPNPTTILESMAWGFPVICTPQSGYYETDYMRNIYRDDITKSMEIIKSLQNLGEAEVRKWVELARQAVEKEYNWEWFTGKILNHIVSV